MPLIKPPPPSSTDQGTGGTGEGKTASFAPCSRSTYASGNNDWLHIQGFSNFDICPDCYNVSIKPTQYAQFLAPSSPKPETVATRCDFSDLWVRIAYGWLYAQNQPDLTLLGRVSELQDPEGPCPNLDTTNEDVKNLEKPTATRTWHCLYDPRTSSLVDDLTVCSDCISHISTIFPSLDGIFRPAADGAQCLATCDLLHPQQSRFLKYIDAFVLAAKSSLNSSHPETTSLISYIRKWAPIPPCKTSTLVKNTKCYTLPRVPEFSVCEEHYHEHIRPLYQSSPQPHLLSQISPQPTTPKEGFMCDLYSPRLKAWFDDACATNDLQTLRNRIRERGAKFVEMRGKMEGLKMQYEQAKMQAEYHFGMMNIRQSSAMTQSLSWSVAGWSAPADYSGADAEMSHAGQAQLQANMTMANMEMLQKEWDEQWD